MCFKLPFKHKSNISPEDEKCLDPAIRKKNNGTDLRYRQRLLMLTDLCIALDLLLAWLLPGGRRFMLVLGLIVLALAFVSRSDSREEMNSNGRIAAVGSLFLAVVVFLCLRRPLFRILGPAELLFLVAFAAWPYRKHLLKNRKPR